MWRSIGFGIMLATIACAQVPRNLDFGEGEPGKAPPYWLPDRPSAETRQEGCAPAAACAVVTGGQISQNIDATLYRGKPIRVSAWLRNGAQLWVRVDGPAKTSNLFNNLADKPVRSRVWARSELSLFVDQNAATIEFGVTAAGTGPAWVRDVSLEPEDSAPFIPRNLDFAAGEADRPPPGWYVYPERAGYKALATHDGCQSAPSCGILFAPPETPASGGAIVQTVDATQYRGKTVRLRAWVRLASSAPDDVAHLFIQDRNDLRAREIRGQEWAEYDAIRPIDPASSTMSFGLMLNGTGSARIERVRLDIVPDGEAMPLSVAPAGGDNMPLAAASATSPASQSIPDSGPPSIEETRRIINNAARIALSWKKSIPDFICAQTIRRSRSADGRNWKTDDTLTVLLGSAGGKELHKLVSVNNKPAKVSYESVRGAIPEGEFDGALGEIFRPGAASFWWDSETAIRGHAVHVYRYEVTPQKSQFTLFFGATQWSAVVGHHGLVFIDRESGQALRLIRIAYLPKDAPLRADIETIDSDYVDVAGMQYLLPIRAEMLLTTGADRFRDEVEFQDYRKFTAEASVSFDDAGDK